MSNRRLRLVSDQVDDAEISIILRELRRVLDSGILGDIVEFGCYVGTTSIYLQDELISRTPLRSLHVYDSFEGLPEKTHQDQSPAGVQFKAGELAASKSMLIKNFRRFNLPLPTITQAWFKDLTPKDIPKRIAFAFLDGDFYDSISASFAIISASLSPGATVVVDDYHSETLPGAARATDEWLLLNPSAHCYVEHSLAIIRLPL